MSTLQFSRNTKVFIEQNGVVWEIPILEDFSFSQATETSEITLNEMETAGVSRRSRSMFTDAYAPAEWSFSTYMRPNSGTSAGYAIEEVLWANFVAPNSFTPDGSNPEEGSWATGVTKADAASVDFDFSGSNRSAIGTFNLYFLLGACGNTIASGATPSGVTAYRISNAVANSASIDFEIDGIAMISWSGFGAVIEEIPALPVAFDSVISAGVDSTSNFIRNRLTSLSVDGSDARNDAAIQDSYNVTLTGGNITFENNITYLTPETLCVVNQPLEHVTGTRSISGNFTCYLDSSVNGSEDLFEDIQGATDSVRNFFGLNFAVGGASGTPRVNFVFPQAHLEIPVHSIEDVISVDVNFHALASDPSSTDEATIEYTGS